MSIQVLHAHTGSSIRSNVDSFSSLDDFRSWIARKTSIQAPNQILMTGNGKPVKFQTLAQEQEIFLYDREVLVSSSTASRLFSTSEDAFTPYQAPNAPDAASSSETLHDLQETTQKYQEWAQTVLKGASDAVEQVRSLDRQNSVMQRATSIAVENIRNHMATLTPKYTETKAWAEQIYTDQSSILQQWRGAYESLGPVKVNSTFSQCLKEGEVALARAEKKARVGDNHSLQDYIDYDELVQVDAAAKEVAEGFAVRLRDLNTVHRAVERDAQATVDKYEQSAMMMDSDLADQASRLLEEVEVLAKKIRTDYQRMAGFNNDEKARSQALRIAQMHINHFVPSVVQTVDEINLVGTQLAQQKRDTLQTSTHHLQKISSIESRISSLHAKLAKLDVDPDSEELFNILDFTIRLPSVYGLCLVEYVRRTEIAPNLAAVHGDAASLDLENKRRAQWVESTGEVLQFTDQVNTAFSNPSVTHDHRQGLPKVTRQDIHQYLQHLSSLMSLKEALHEVQNAMRTLETVTKRPSAFATAFKNGSIHEAGTNRDMAAPPPIAQSVQALQREKSKADEKLRSAESRIRKLEDLLHRQSQMPRPPSANGFTLNHAPSFERQVTSPITNFTSALSSARPLDSRRSSTSSRRVSQNLDAEEKNLAQRILNLEAELMGQRDLVKELKKDKKARMNAEETVKQQALEAIATKEDLLVNMESQQREFDNERRLIRDENATLTARLEEAEDELDRALSNTENDTKLNVLQEEVDQLRGHIHELESARRKEFELHQDEVKGLQMTNKERLAHNTELDDTLINLRVQQREQENTRSHQQIALQATLQHLSGDSRVVNDDHELVMTLEGVAKAAASQRNEMLGMLEQLRNGKAAADATVESQRKELIKQQGLLEITQESASHLEEQRSAIQTENNDTRSEMQSLLEEKENLSSMFKSSEAEVEALKTQVASHTTSYEDLNVRFTSLQSFHGELDDQLREKSEELTVLQGKHHEASAINQTLANRAGTVSKRLQLQIEGLRKVVEHVGLMIVQQDEKMVIQKAPKQPANASITLADPSLSMRRSVSGPLPSNAELEALVDENETLQWASTIDPSVSSSLYTAFINNTSLFDLEVFNEAIFKRVKEIEHIARKWQREAKSYREKAHRSQSEVHERIALRSFKEGDLALFLPTRDQATKPWAAFNVGAPHYFLREQDSHKLGKRDWLIARITRVEERVVDLSRSLNPHNLTISSPSTPNAAAAATKPFSNMNEMNDNPYELSDGLRWYLVDAHEEKPGAPIAVAQGKATVALAPREEEPIRASIGPMTIRRQGERTNEASRTLARSLDSRRSSTNSRKSWIGGVPGGAGGAGIAGTKEHSSGSGGPGSGGGGLESMLRRTDSRGSHQSRKSGDGREGDREREREREPSRMSAVQTAGGDGNGDDNDNDDDGNGEEGGGDGDNVSDNLKRGGAEAPPLPEWMHQIWEG